MTSPTLVGIALLVIIASRAEKRAHIGELGERAMSARSGLGFSAFPVKKRPHV
jgi:hypothetical protein